MLLDHVTGFYTHSQILKCHLLILFQHVFCVWFTLQLCAINQLSTFTLQNAPRLRRCGEDFPKSGKDVACMFLPVASLSLEVKWKWLFLHYYILQVASCHTLAISSPFSQAGHSFASCQDTTFFVHVRIAFSFQLLSRVVNLHPLPMIVEKWISSVSK